MNIKNQSDCPAFRAGDDTLIQELLHPGRNPGISLACSLARASLPPRSASLPHRLSSTEVYYILEGSGHMYIDGENAPVKSGDIVYIPPFATQHITNTGDQTLVFLCIVDPAWRKEDEAVL